MHLINLNQHQKKKTCGKSDVKSDWLSLSQLIVIETLAKMNYLIVILILFSLSNGGYTQSNPITLDLQTSRLSLPFSQFPLQHPRLLIGKSFRINKSLKNKIYWENKLGYFYHKDLQQGFSISTGTMYDFHLKKGIILSSAFSTGYLHTFFDGKVYEWSGEKYKKKTNHGRANLISDFNIAIGYDLQTISAVPIELKLNYGVFLQTPFSKTIPIVLYSYFGLSAQYFIKFKNEKND